MYNQNTYDNQPQTNVVGSFITDKNIDFKDNVVSLLEGFQGAYNINPVNDIAKVLGVDSFREDYKERLLGDIAQESMDDPYLAMFPQKMNQLFDNSAYEILEESTSYGNLAPIVGLSLPILKKNFIECHSKDVVMTEVPDKPIVNVAFERKYLKGKHGEKNYIPDIFYNDSYKEALEGALGKKISTDWYPSTGNLPFQDLDLLTASGGTLQTRDSLGYDFVIDAVQVEVPDAAGTGTQLRTISGLNIMPNMTTGTFSAPIKAQGFDAAGTVVVDNLLGQVQFDYGKVSISSTSGKVKKVQFGGHLSNQNNTESVELDRERTTMSWQIPEGHRINTGLTVEKLKDMKALFNSDYTAETVVDLTEVLNQIEDSTVFNFLDKSLTTWKARTDLPFGYESFVESYEFSATPPATVVIPTSQWVNSELKYTLDRELDSLKEKLKSPDIMFVVYGNPANVTLLRDDVRWVINEDTKIGGVTLDYKFGVLTNTKDRVHVVSSLKVPRSKGLRIVAFPVTKDIITFKHLKYSLNIENVYRNPATPLTPNIMGTSRYLTKEVLPVQGELIINNSEFGRKPL